MPAAETAPVSLAEADALFADLVPARSLILAVSGGPELNRIAGFGGALARGNQAWAEASRRDGRSWPAAGIGAGGARGRTTGARLGVRHRTLRWSGRKPETGVQEAARAARYRLLAAAAKAVGAHHF